MYAKFKINFLNNSRLNFGDLNDVFPHIFFLMCTRNREYIWEPRHFNRLFRKEKKIVFFPKKLASLRGRLPKSGLGIYLGTSPF